MLPSPLRQWESALPAGPWLTRSKVRRDSCCKPGEVELHLSDLADWDEVPGSADELCMLYSYWCVHVSVPTHVDCFCWVVVFCRVVVVVVHVCAALVRTIATNGGHWGR